MATIHIMAPLRTLTGGETEVVVSGATLSEIVDNLESRFPGIKSRLAQGDRLRPGLALFVNGDNAPSYLTTRIPPEAEIYFAPAISGG
jgi:molybdopterin synthase sulfur carrier subunit